MHCPLFRFFFFFFLTLFGNIITNWAAGVVFVRSMPFFFFFFFFFFLLIPISWCWCYPRLSVPLKSCLISCDAVVVVVGLSTSCSTVCLVSGSWQRTAAAHQAQKGKTNRNQLIPKRPIVFFFFIILWDSRCIVRHYTRASERVDSLLVPCFCCCCCCCCLAPAPSYMTPFSPLSRFLYLF